MISSKYSIGSTLFLTSTLMLMLSACRSTAVDSSRQAMDVSEDNASADCSSSEAAAIVVALNQAIILTVKDQANLEALKDFISSDDIGEYQKGSYDLSPYICIDRNQIAQSDTLPVQIYTLTANGTDSFGGIILFRGNLFIEGFFRSRANLNSRFPGMFDREKYVGKEYLKLFQQPWFEKIVEEPNSFRYEFHKTGGSAELLKILAEITPEKTLDLYRGVKFEYATEESVTKRVALGNSTSAISGFGPFASIFTTPDYSKALGWGQAPGGVVNHYAIPFEVLQNKLNDKNINSTYVGIEYDYIEIAFVDSEFDKFLVTPLHRVAASGGMLEGTCRASNEVEAKMDSTLKAGYLALPKCSDPPAENSGAGSRPSTKCSDRGDFASRGRNASASAKVRHSKRETNG